MHYVIGTLQQGQLSSQYIYISAVQNNNEYFS